MLQYVDIDLRAITPHSITDTGMAVGLEAGIGLDIAIYFYTNFYNSVYEPIG